MKALADVDPQAEVEALARSRQPYLIGIRHHSPTLAYAVPRLLDQAEPDLLLLELPEELQDWLPWLAAEEAVAPLALAAARRDGQGLVFYPYADFSPELAAVRWARAHNVPVEAFDLPVGVANDRDPRGRTRLAPDARAPLSEALARSANADDPDELWDRAVEARAAGAEPEAVRRAALAVGWSLRFEHMTWGQVPLSDLQREAWMRQQLHGAIAAGAQRPAAVIGAFHASALLEPTIKTGRAKNSAPEPKRRARKPAEVITSLVPYGFDLLDSRTGYPAGIRDPAWQQAIFEADGSPAAIEHSVRGMALLICRELRRHGQAAGVPDAREVSRLALDLSRLRGLPAAARRELVESLQTVLAQGEPFGRGRAVAAAMQVVLVGDRRGELAPGTPRSGLGPHVEQLLAELRLPGPESRDPVEVRLDPLRSQLDRRRHITLQRLAVCDVPYATPISVDPDLLTGRWILRWRPATAATLEVASMRGVTLEQAAEGSLRMRLARAVARGGPTARQRLTTLEDAAECSLPELANQQLGEFEQSLPHQATLPELVEALELCDRLARGHIPGFVIDASGLTAEMLRLRVVPALSTAAVVGVEGLSGSDRLQDAAALLALTQRLRAGMAIKNGDTRLRFALQKLEAEGSPLMQGAAGAVRMLLGHIEPDTFGEHIGSWLDASGAAQQPALSRRLAGALSMAAPLLEAAPGVMQRFIERVGALDDRAFLERVPALREAFEILSPAARQRFLQALRPHVSDSFDPRLERLQSAAQLARWAEADLHAREVIARDFPELLEPPHEDPSTLRSSPLSVRGPRGLRPLENPPKRRTGTVTAILWNQDVIRPEDRWRLILGVEREQLPGLAARAGAALDELYGEGFGEGANVQIGVAQRPLLAVRDWAAELEEVFGARVREQVLGRAAARGRSDVLFELNPDSVTPSIELLQQLLSLKGGLSDDRLPRLRRLVDHVVQDLVRELASQLRPALAGSVVSRPTRRKSGPLDLRRTLDRNLRSVRFRDDGTPQLAPDRLIFKTRARRSLDWRIILVVDVSGSMEASVIYSALMAAILSGLPAVTAHFVAFSTGVVDLSSRVHDPLGLLLEVVVGGATDIARALRYARQLISVPSRTLVLLVTDFEEGGPLPALLSEVRAVAESGARPLGLAALDARGAPRYSRAIAEQVAAAGMPIAALSPEELARWIGEQIHRH